MKRLLSIFISIVVFSFYLLPVYAIGENVLSQRELSEIRTIAINMPSVLGYEHTWSITQETPLYNINDELIAYCIDMKSKDSPSINSYTIVSVKETEFPILLFGYKGTSAYLGKRFDRAYYFGTLDFYIKNGNIYQNTRRGITLTYKQVKGLFKENDDADTTNYFSTRQRYLGNNRLLLQQDASKINNGANLQWRKGCSPTAVAMLIKTRIPTMGANTLIDSLALYMETASDGSTPLNKVPSGTNSYYANNTWLTAPTTCGWNSTKSDGSPRTGSLYNSKASFKTSILAGFPVGVYCSSSNVTTTGFPNGIGAHMMSGIGYSFGSSGDYIICYTTNTADGEVSFPLTSSGLNNRAWFWLKW